MESYDATGAARRIQEFVDDLSNWYVRRSRRRFWDPARSGGDREGRDKLAGYATLHECLTTIARLMAPIAPFVSEALHRNLTAGRDSSAPDSVHLTDFPDADDTLIDPHLDEAMATARAVVSLGRQVRTEAKVRVRQPLGHAAVHVSGDRVRLAPLLPLIGEELNVKDVRFAESAEELSAWRAKPNFRKLGPALGPRVKEVAAALAADRGEMSSALARGEAVQISFPSGPLTLEPADVELVQQSRTGWGSASDGSVTVALDLEPDEALRREGLVRELIHHVQNLRKSSGLDVTDRIVVGMEADPDVAAAVDAHYDRFASEVLATNVRPQPVDGPTGEAELSVDGHKVRVTLRPA
jgi:isoleucyl-tRNA synthetase